MASSYPGGLDAFSTSHQDNVGEIVHASIVNDLDDAVNKIEAELGTLPKGNYTSAKARLNNVEFPFMNGQAGTAYTLTINDISDVVSMTNASPNTVTIPTNTAVAFPYPGDGGVNGCTQITIRQGGSGLTAIAPQSGVTLQARGLTSGTMHLAGQFAYATLTKVAINTWELSGDIVQ